MKKLNINITKAQILSFSVNLRDKAPDVTVSLGLFTEGGKKITDYEISTQAWLDENKFELPMEVIPLIIDTMKILERVVVKHARDGQKQLVATSDKPIDLSEVPF